MNLDQYINSINLRYKQGNATVHTFCGDLQQLTESLVPDVRATNGHKRKGFESEQIDLTTMQRLYLTFKN